MRYASLVDRIATDQSTAWHVHWVGTQREAAGEDVIFFSIGDPDFATPEPIVDAAVAALRAGDTHYASIEGREELRGAVADRFASRSGVAVGPDNVAIVAGTQNALFSTGMCVLGVGDEAVTLDPMYVTYQATFAATGADVVAVPSGPGFRPDADAVAAAITPRTRVLAMTTPSNPTGVVASRDELAALARLAIENDLWVIADEVYGELVFDGEHISMASIDGMAERTATVSSLSKSHAMTGWRCGWVIGPTELVEHVGRLAMPMVYGLPGFVQEAAVAAVADADTITAKMRATYLARRDLVCRVLAEADDLPVLSPDAGMYVMIDVRGRGMTSSEFSWALMERKNVSALDAGVFGATTDGWLRLAFTIGEQRLEEGCRRIVELCRELPRLE